MPKRKQKQKKSNPLTMVGNPPPPPPPLVCNITTTTTSTTSSNSASNHHYNNNGNNNSQGNTRGQTTNHDTTTNTTTNRNTIDRMPPIAFPPPATGTTTTTTTTFHIPSSHAEILKKYSISEKTFSKLKATFDSVIPRAVQNSLESLMDMAVHEHPNAPSSHNLPSFTPTTTNTTRRGGLPTGDLVQEEFTIAGNTLLPTMSHRFGHGGNVASATGGKKRPRDFTPGHASSTTCPNVLHHGENSNSMRSNRQQEMDSLNVSGVMLGDDDDDDDDDDIQMSHIGSQPLDKHQQQQHQQQQQEEQVYAKGIELYPHRIRNEYQGTSSFIGLQSFIFPICHDAEMYTRVKDHKTFKRQLDEILIDPGIMKLVSEENDSGDFLAQSLFHFVNDEKDPQQKQEEEEQQQQQQQQQKSVSLQQPKQIVQANARNANGLEKSKVSSDRDVARRKEMARRLVARTGLEPHIPGVEEMLVLPMHTTKDLDG